MTDNISNNSQQPISQPSQLQNTDTSSQTIHNEEDKTTTDTQKTSSTSLTGTQKTELTTTLSQLKDGITNLGGSYMSTAETHAQTPSRMQGILSSGQFSSTTGLKQAIKQIAITYSLDTKITNKLQTLSMNKTVTTKEIMSLLAKIETDMEELNKEINKLETILGKVDKEMTTALDDMSKDTADGKTEADNAIQAQNGMCPPSQASFQTSMDKSSENFSNAEFEGKEATQLGSESKLLEKAIKSMKTELGELQNAANDLMKALIEVSTGVDSTGQDKGRTGPSHTSLYQNVSKLINKAKKLMSQAGSEQIKALGDALGAAVQDFNYGMTKSAMKSYDVAADAWFTATKDYMDSVYDADSDYMEGGGYAEYDVPTESSEASKSFKEATMDENPFLDQVSSRNFNTGKKFNDTDDTASITAIVDTLTTKYKSIQSELSTCTETASKTIGLPSYKQTISDLGKVIDGTETAVSAEKPAENTVSATPKISEFSEKKQSSDDTTFANPAAFSSLKKPLTEVSDGTETAEEALRASTEDDSDEGDE